MSVGIIVCLSVLLFDLLSAYPIKETDIQTIHPSVARPSVHPSIIYPINCHKPSQAFKACPKSLEGSGHLALADARNGIKVNLNQSSWLSWNHIFVSILKCVPMDKRDGLQPHSFRLCFFLKLFITPTIGRMTGHIVFELCILAYSRTYGRT